ncbi:hypothetical protein OBRU01_25458, partial [Operophtera brumata]
MEAKLREYRAVRRRKELIDNAKEKLEKTKDKLVNFLVPTIFKDMDKDKNEEEVLLDPCDAASETSEVESFAEPNQESWKYFILKWSLYSVIWVSLFMYFIMVQFGAVFFTLSVLVGIYLNTRTRPRKSGEVSAYSVFNRDCQSINGTLDAEQLQRQ